MVPLVFVINVGPVTQPSDGISSVGPPGIYSVGLQGTACGSANPWYSWTAKARVPNREIGSLTLTVKDEVDNKVCVASAEPGSGELSAGCFNVPITIGVGYRAVAELTTTDTGGKQTVETKMSDWISCNPTE
jgi:hypothetical protein